MRSAASIASQVPRAAFTSGSRRKMRSIGALSRARTFTSSSTTVPSASFAQRCVLYSVTGRTLPRTPSSRAASSTARRKEPSCCASAARNRLPNAIPLSSGLLSVSNRWPNRRRRTGSPSASTAIALRMSPGAGTSSAMRTLPVDRPESVTPMIPVMSSVCSRIPAMTVGAPRPPPRQTTRSDRLTTRILSENQGSPGYARAARCTVTLQGDAV